MVILYELLGWGLSDIITDEWDSLKKYIIVNSISNMKNQIQACIEAEGGHTKYQIINKIYSHVFGFHWNFFVHFYLSI